MDIAASSAFGKATGPHCDLSWAKAVRPKEGKKDQKFGRVMPRPMRARGNVIDPVLNGVEKQFDLCEP
jgi:hypothetical protein